MSNSLSSTIYNSLDFHQKVMYLAQCSAKIVSLSNPSNHRLMIAHARCEGHHRLSSHYQVVSAPAPPVQLVQF